MNFGGESRLSSQLQLRATHRAHYSSRQQSAANGRATQGVAFGELLRDGIESVSEAQKSHATLAREAIINPEEVDAHDVTIAAAQADLSIRLARNIIDRALTAYREIISLR